MGLFDQITGMLAGGQSAGGNRGLFDLVDNLVQQNGGFNGLIAKLQAAGLDQQVKSWIGLGPNQDVSGDQVEAAVGSDRISKLAESLGIDKAVVLARISEFLPKIVDKMSPTGELPPDSLIDPTFSALKNNVADDR